MPLADVTRYDRDYTDFTLRPQTTIPSCAAPPPACTLAFTGTTTVVNVTLRGDDDGTITCYWSGSTGTTTCYINGVSDGNETGDSHVFTGLTAGYYSIKIVEGECFEQQTDVQVLDGEFRTGSFTVNTPVSLSAAENPIILNLKTARNTEGGGIAYSEGNIDVDGTISDGDKLVFTFTYPQAYVATFYAKEFPNRDTYFLASVLKDSTGVSVGANSATEIATSILEVLEKDSVISRLYYLRSTDEVVYLKAKEGNTKLDINTVLAETSVNLDVTQTTNGNAAYDGQITENYSLYSDILINNTTQYGEDPDISTFNKVAQLELPFNSASNVHLFDLSDVLKNFVYTPKIDFTLTGFTTISNMLCGYKVSYGEKYPLVANSTTKKSRVKGTTSTLYALNTALAWEEENTLVSYLGNTLHNLKSKFDGTFTLNSPATHNVTLVIDDYLIDTGNTKTTNIAFRVNDTYNSDVYGWQTGTTFEMTGSTIYPYYYQGTIDISGSTSGVTVQYTRSFIVLISFYIGDIYAGTAESNVVDNVKFLTSSPNPKFIQRDSSEFLYLMMQKDYGKTLKIKGDLYFYDGTTLTGETLYTVSTGSTNYGGVFMFAAGYNELGLADYETYSGGTRKIRRVDFALYQHDDENGDYLLSEEKSYRYEIDEQPRRYGVAFLNKLGTYDIFDFAGEIINSVTHSNESYEVPRALNLRGASPFGFQANTVYNTKVINIIAANTGWIDEDHFDWLIELLESNRCYNYTETDQSFLIVKTVNYTKSSNDDLYQIDVTFEETLWQNNISV